MDTQSPLMCPAAVRSLAAARPWDRLLIRSLAVRALRGLHDHHLIDCFYRDQGARRARMARLTASTGLSPRALGTLRPWRIARRRAGGMAGPVRPRGAGADRCPP